MSINRIGGKRISSEDKQHELKPLAVSMWEGGGPVIKCHLFVMVLAIT